MPRGKKGGSVFFDGTRYIVRHRYTDLKGRRKEKKRVVSTEKEVVRAQREIEREIESLFAGNPITVQQRTFKHLVAFYKDTEMKPAEYVGDIKVSGLRSYRKFASRLKPLERFFGSMHLSTITYHDIADFKTKRLATPTIRGKQRSIESVHRELSMLRHMMYLALRERWILEHPFHRGKPLIKVSEEKSRMRILSWDEEERLLAACVGPRKSLKLKIIFALETGLRQGEQFTLERRDVDLDDRMISLRSRNAKTAIGRVIPLFGQLQRELAGHLETVESTGRVFKDRDPKKAFRTACKLAGIEGLRWHDLRHTAITRMLHFYKLQEAEVMRISGHTDYKTFLRYVNIDKDIALRIARQVDAAREELDTALLVESESIPEAPDFSN